MRPANRRGSSLTTWILVAGAVSPGFGTVGAEDGAPRPGPTEDEIRGWVEDLGSSEWQERDDAEKALLGSGDAVLPAIALALDDADLERRHRAGRVWRAILWERAAAFDPEVREWVAEFASLESDARASRLAEFANHASPETARALLVRILVYDRDARVRGTALDRLLGLTEPRLVRRIEEALAASPFPGERPALLGRLHLARGARGKAIAAFEDAVRTSPDDADLRLELARLLAEAGEWAEGEVEFEAAARLGGPDSRAEAWLGRGECLVALGRESEGVEALELVRDAGAPDRAFFERAGGILSRAGLVEERIGWLEAAARALPDEASEMHADRAFLDAWRGRPERALGAVVEAYELSASPAEGIAIARAAARLARDSGRLAEARTRPRLPSATGPAAWKRAVWEGSFALAAGDPGSAAAIYEDLAAAADAPPAIRREFVRVLGAWRDSAALPAIERALGGEIRGQEPDLVAALLAIDSDAARARFAEMLSDRRPGVRAAAARAAGASGDARWVESLRDLAIDRVIGVRRAAAEALLRLAWPDEGLLDIVRSAKADSLIRLAVVQKAASVSQESQAPSIREFLRQAAVDREPTVRAAALLALARSDPQFAAGLLERALATEAEAGRVAAASGIAHVGAPAARRLASLAEKDASPRVREAALEAARLASDPYLGVDLAIRRILDEDPAVALLAAGILAERGSRMGQGVLERAIESPDPHERRRVVEAISAAARRRSAAARRWIEARANDPDPGVRQSAVRVLDPAWGESAQRALSRALGDPVGNVRRTAIERALETGESEAELLTAAWRAAIRSFLADPRAPDLSLLAARVALARGRLADAISGVRMARLAGADGPAVVSVATSAARACADPWTRWPGSLDSADPKQRRR